MTRPTYIEIDLAALQHNARVARALAGDRRVSAAVKGDAYGHGMTQCATILAEHADSLAVACCEEAARLLEAGLECPVNVLEGPFDQDDAAFIVHNNLETVVHTPAQLDLLISAKLQPSNLLWLKIDTGMHRLGLQEQELEILIKRLEKLGHHQVGLMSHLGDAECPASEMTISQLKRWSVIAERYAFPTSLFNSAALLQSYNASSDWVRPGIMLYGASGHTNQATHEFLPVMHLNSSVMAVRHIEAGEFVGYGGRWQAPRASRVATIPVGYGDGYPRTAINATPVWINGDRCPLIGRVSMDMITVDVTDHPSVEAGSPVELWGKNLPVTEVASKADTIGYELLTRLPNRTPRRWIAP